MEWGAWRTLPAETFKESRELGEGAYEVTHHPLPSETAFRVTSQRHMHQVIANKHLNVNTAEPNNLIYNQIIRLQ